MKILWCTALYLVFNNYQTIASKFPNENEDTKPRTMVDLDILEKFLDENLQRFDKASETSFLEQNEQRFESLEKLIEENIESNNKRFEVLEKLLGIQVEKVDCSEKCAKDESCTSVFWSNSSDSECRFNQDKNTLVKFLPGELYFCKDCQTTIDLVLEAEYSGVIKLVNVATNKNTQASSYANAISDPSKAVDGDPNTWFFSEPLLIKGEPWLMVDLGQRFLVAQIRIQIRTKPIQKIRGGYFQVCLVDDFNREVNPCNQDSEILKLNRRLSGYSNLFDVENVQMGRYVVIRKLKEQILEIAEIEVLSVNPIMSYECASCLTESNTVCDESRIPPVCSCAENHFPVDGDARKGCKDPCNEFIGENASCTPIDSEMRNCTCEDGFYAVEGNSCNGCRDPCLEFFGVNESCIPIDFEKRLCICNEGFYAVGGNACNGCRDPCQDFVGENALCSPIDYKNMNCTCKEGFKAVGKDACNDCESVCPIYFDYYKEYLGFGCLKAHYKKAFWDDARKTCQREGGDLFSPGHSLPILPKEFKLSDLFWIGVRRDNSYNRSPYKRISDSSVLPDDSPLWVIGEPGRGVDECAYYRSNYKQLHDYRCNSSFYFICQVV